MAIKRKIKRSVESDDTLLIEALDEYLIEKQALGCSQATINTYTNSINKFIKDIDGENNTCGFITEQILFKWINDMRGDEQKITTINSYLRDVRTFLYWCMHESREYIKPSFKIKMLAGQEETVKTFTEDEQKALLVKPHRSRNSDFTEWRTWAIVNFVLATGARASTICNIKMEDVDYDTREIEFTHTKNKKAQTMVMSSRLHTVLSEYKRKWRNNVEPTGYFFPNIGDEKMTTNALRISFGRYCKDRGVNKSSIHGLRHSFAKGYLLNNGNMFKLQKLLGHSTLDMTKKYVNLFDDDLRENFDKHSPLDNLNKKMSRSKSIKNTAV